MAKSDKKIPLEIVPSVDKEALKDVSEQLGSVFGNIPVTVGSCSGAVVLNNNITEKQDWSLLIDRQNGVVLADNGNELILLKELLRLGHLRGILDVQSTIVQAPNPNNGYSAASSVRVTFSDGKSFSGSADAFEANLDKDFSSYPTAIAESRALARALRFGLNITMCSVEEVSSKTIKKAASATADGKISAAQRQCVEELCRRKNIELTKVLSLGSRQVTNLDLLTIKEARDLITSLNDGTVEKELKKGN
mgnify:CR=1 FL=1